MGLEQLDEFPGRLSVALLGIDEQRRYRLISRPRARESGKVDCHLGIVAISNKIEYRDRLNERIKSSLREEEFAF